VTLNLDHATVRFLAYELHRWAHKQGEQADLTFKALKGEA
jgi:hypothetical protein